MRKLWGGAFQGAAETLADEFGSSIESDLTFWREDVLGSIAHAEMLGATGILSTEDSELLVRGLRQILEEGPDALPTDVEDIHTAVESRLGELVGEAAGRLHTARSRNDQVATDIRLWLRTAAADLRAEIKQLQTVLADLADRHQSQVVTGFTHQQHAQPITLGFHFLAHFWAFQRHGRRLEHLAEMIDSCPLGSAALSGSAWPIDRFQTAESLGFAAPTPNALDATSDRSFILDAQHACALLMIDLSRISQELILWCSPEFGWVRLSDGLTTGSSIMPQKRNADMAELIRGKTGGVIGAWTALAATMKGLILGYNRDTQEDKPPLFASMRTVRMSLALVRRMLETAEIDSARMSASCSRDFSTATDLADHLAQTGMPFRRAHEVAGNVVRWCRERGTALEDLVEADLQATFPEVPVSALTVLDPAASAASRDSYGGTGRAAVVEGIRLARQRLEAEGFHPVQ
ncbi:MAG: argininosuccinate lyase [Fimbriimonadaceae bacterium]|nr:argininosuccinate lyase [Fimbriimonadaceae bacterium]